MMQGRRNERRCRGSSSRGRLICGVLAVILLSLAAVGSTLAYIAASSDTVTNTFEPARMACAVLEDFSDGTVKKNVCIQNTGDGYAYIRVKLLPYWYEKDADTIVAKSAWVPEFTPGQGWTLGADGYYYYNVPVAPGDTTSVLIPAVTLGQDDVSLARQVLEIMASCIQAEPADAVKEAWSGDNGSVTDVVQGSLVVAQAQGG